MNCIEIRNSSYKVSIRNKFFKIYKTFKDLDEAKNFRNIKQEEYENLLKEEREKYKKIGDKNENNMLCIFEKDSSWCVQIKRNGKSINKNFKDLEKAIEFRDKTLENLNQQENKKIYETPITYTEEGIPYIELKHKNETYKTLVDEDKWHFLKTKSLSYDGNYVRIKDKTKNQIEKNYTNYQLNKYIYETFVGPVQNDVVDHINQNKLDNRVVNLRDTTYSINGYNRTTKPSKTGYKGVYKKNDRNKYYAVIHYNRKRYSSIGYETAKEAAIEYNRIALELYGNNAILNNIEDN